MKGDPLQMMFNYVSGGTGYEFKGVMRFMKM